MIFSVFTIIVCLFIICRNIICVYEYSKPDTEIDFLLEHSLMIIKFTFIEIINT